MMSDLVTRWAQRDRVREAAMSTSAARDLVARYVAGQDLDDLIPVLISLIDKGLLVSVGYLGDHVNTLEQAAANKDVYLTIVRRLSDEGISSSSELSLRLSRLGQRLGAEGRHFALGAARTICLIRSAPRRCPASRGHPLLVAQRPLPSMMIATWRTP